MGGGGGRLDRGVGVWMNMNNSTVYEVLCCKVQGGCEYV